MSEADPLAAYMTKVTAADSAPSPAAPGAPDSSDPLAAYMERQTKAKVPGGGKGDTVGGAAQAFTEHAGNQLTMGYLPHIQAALGPDIEKTLDLVTGQDATNAPTLSKVIAALKLTQPHEVVQSIMKQAFTPDKEYIGQRDLNIKRMDQERKDYPISSVAGDVAGLVGGAVLTAGAGTAAEAVPAGFSARSMLAAKNIGQAAGRGAVQAGLWNPGDTEGQDGGLQLDKRIANAKFGAAIGGAVQGGFEAAPLLKGAVKAVGAKIGSALSGETPEIVANYATNTDRINNLIKESGGDVSQMTDQAREKIQGAIRTYRQSMGGKISSALGKAPQEANIPNQPILDALEGSKKGLSTVYKSDAIAAIDGMIEKIKAGSTQGGEGAREGFMSPTMLNDAKEFLQDQAKSAYMKGGQIFQNSKEAAQAARSGAAVARKALNEAVPEVAQANNQLAALHMIEDRLNKNLIKPGGSDAAMLAAGAGTNPRNARMLQKLGDITGIPALETAKDLATARAFGSPSFLPSDHTGKAAARIALAAGAGHLLGPTGYVLGAAASPAAVKMAINAGNVAGKLAGGLSVGPGIQSGAGYVANAAAAGDRQGLLAPAPKDLSDDPGVQQFFKSNPRLLENIQDQDLRGKISTKINQSPDRSPSQSPRGEELWAQNGAKMLGIQGDQARQLMATPAGKNLLIQASNLKPGSKAMQQLQERVQTHLKGAK